MTISRTEMDSAGMFEPEQDEIDAFMAQRRAHPLSGSWAAQGPGLGHWFSRATGLYVIESVKRERDGRLWHHVSYSRRSSIPTWPDTAQVKAEFIGDDRECYAVLPSRERWVNHHPYTLHLWHCLDVPGGALLPDFRHAGMI